MPSQPSDSEGLHTGSWKDGIGPYHDDDDDESTDEIGGHQNDRQSRARLAEDRDRAPGGFEEDDHGSELSQGPARVEGMGFVVFDDTTYNGYPVI
eukprot:3257085-Rhodomonas_salina.1